MVPVICPENSVRNYHSTLRGPFASLLLYCCYPTHALNHRNTNKITCCIPYLWLTPHSLPLSVVSGLFFFFIQSLTQWKGLHFLNGLIFNNRKNKLLVWRWMRSWEGKVGLCACYWKPWGVETKPSTTLQRCRKRVRCKLGRVLQQSYKISRCRIFILLLLITQKILIMALT